MQYFYSSLLTLSLLAIGNVAVAYGKISPQPENKYSPEFIQSYNRECMQTSMGEGLEEPEAKQLCNCTIEEFQRQYSQAEFKQLTTASATDKKAETALVEVGQVCFEKILYEQQ